MATFVAVKFKRVVATFDEVAKRWICESSGTEQSSMLESLTHLLRLVNSFLEGETTKKLEEIDANRFDESENLRNLLNSDENSGDDLKRSIIEAVENALLAGEANYDSSPKFNCG